MDSVFGQALLALHLRLQHQLQCQLLRQLQSLAQEALLPTGRNLLLWTTTPHKLATQMTHTIALEMETASVVYVPARLDGVAHIAHN